MNTLKFTLKELMDNKFGIDQFALACEITARWVQFETKDKSFDSSWIYKMATAKAADDFELMEQPANALSRLFGLKSFEKLFTHA
jgi:hypothetical protein